MDIYEVKTYVDDQGRQITGKIPVNTEGFQPEIQPLYEGTVGIPTQMGVMPFSFSFPENSTLEACFNTFEATAKQAFEEAKREHQDKNRIVTPGEAAQGKMLNFPRK